MERERLSKVAFEEVEEKNQRAKDRHNPSVPCTTITIILWTVPAHVRRRASRGLLTQADFECDALDCVDRTAHITPNTSLPQTYL